MEEKLYNIEIKAELEADVDGQEKEVESKILLHSVKPGDEIYVRFRFTPNDVVVADIDHMDKKGQISDGDHTFDELYHHRAVLFALICKNHREIAWKSKQHHDGTMYDGYFIVGIETPQGQATYHYAIEPYWDLFDVKELDKAPEWDGSSAADCIERIRQMVKENSI